MSTKVVKKEKDFLFTCNFHLRLKIKQKVIKYDNCHTCSLVVCLQHIPKFYGLPMYILPKALGILDLLITNGCNSILLSMFAVRAPIFPPCFSCLR